ncbi:MAG: hypothetical protein COV55_00295 [Candidatus Komeilibacteria bacterium CG11_big_fil_rev_8_21_14_0_20_36_20]|uniref:Uncharacterized protein n=1 Tax=Candidatus Komeilibacteria bacterium CG11_big_fil_rev_8_21_14_0_20_36_20 TaxID=1974477 RepID=A0A2H0NEL3_9BACT|nr:MAG: hypothetical protein COV55_00295 [Candidatus Komeilibacteria bacterium CG11_big_fil_rev_8_21_14_0_20_36_20]PIR81551.1 MAG: hypothetical protein COU21_03180 [Candidatus Komeilibacteria bacterium CG10_big_fil_rev_8_21_14_0_10_36_65]PJC55459.1 MAG: hypothetical protein CO027_02020 [Candidatus Komeilibacteria bacterium CG_4_9_14_0_2_um_filter_36_13]
MAGPRFAVVNFKIMEEEQKKSCADKQTCYCGALAAILIIVFIWTAPSWANIVNTVLAALIVLGSLFGCCCHKKKKC